MFWFLTTSTCNNLHFTNVQFIKSFLITTLFINPKTLGQRFVVIIKRVNNMFWGIVVKMRLWFVNLHVHNCFTRLYVHNFITMKPKRRINLKSTKNLKTRIDNMTIRNIKIINILCMRNFKKMWNSKTSIFNSSKSWRTCKEEIIKFISLEDFKDSLEW
jgi:hypothetical protein